MIAEDWMTFKLDRERNVMIKRAQIARFIMIIGYVLAIIGFLSVIVPPYFGMQIMYATNFSNRSKLLPLETFHFYDTDKSPQYELTFFIHIITTLLGAIIYMSCNAVHRAICDLEWYKLESKEARNLIILIIRAHRPFRITAGKIIPLTMATFCSVLKTSSGYISFLVTKHVRFIHKNQISFVLSIVNMMAEDWIAFKQDKERNVMIKQAQIARLIMIIGYVFMVIAVLAVIIPPCFGIPVIYVITNFTSVNKPLPLKTYYFYNTDKSPQFELTFFIHSFTTFLAAIIYICVDIFLILIILHICGQLENFRCRLTDLISCKNFNEVLNNIIETHLRLIRFVDNIENTYSVMINAVYRAMCDLEWYKLESNKARNLILLMIRSKYPFYITAGKIFPLTMGTFCNKNVKLNWLSHIARMLLDHRKHFIWAVELHRLGLKLIGLWPSTDEISKKKLGSNIRMGFIFITVIFVSGVPLVWALIRVWGDMVLMIDNLRITLPLIVVLFKFIIMRWKRKVLLSIVNMMAEDWISLKLNTERDVMIKRARLARLLIIFGFVLMIFAFIMLIIFPCFDIQIRHITNLTDRKKPLPLQTYYFYDTDKSPQFELTFFVQAVTISLAGIIYTSVDAFLGLVIFHICGQLENFRRRLVKLILCKNFNLALNNSIVHHLRLIKFADNIEKTFSLMMLGLVIYFGIVFCLCGFLLVSLLKTSASYISFLLANRAIIPIMNMIAEDWIKSKSVQDRNVMIRRAYTARIIIICAYCIMGLACFFIIILPSFGISMRLTPNITDPGKPMPLQTYYIYDQTKRPQYEITFISQAVYILLATMSYTGIDNFLGLLIFHICGQLDILKNRLTRLDKYINSRNMLKSCIIKHIHLLSAAYNNKWYSVNPKIAKDLLFLLIRGTKPVYLTAGKVFPMTMATFCGVKYFNYNYCIIKYLIVIVIFPMHCYSLFIKKLLRIKNNYYFEWAVKLNRITLDFIGLWPKTARNPRQKLMCNFRVLIVFIAITFGVLIPSIHSFLKIYGDIMLMIDNLQFTLPAISCSIRIAIFWWKKEAITPIIDMIAEDWIELKNAQERNIMIRKAQIARMIVACAYCIMALGCLFIIVPPGFGISIRLTTNITDPGRIVPLQTHYIYDVTKQPQYELTYISQTIYIVLAVLSYTGIDHFLGLLVFHISGQLNILKNRLINLDTYINSHDMLKICVARHIRLLRAITIIEDTYNVILLSLFLYFAILFAFYGFRIINVS
ncbi:Putative odorant receptor 13a [Trachymyrmex septentrionalis]|uniref:Putative odorant receptor 13a n=1 Tax=Trachymyrmex septentrionalis TaxID=34720 RepID=A0A195ESG0_9HYME|nr:Putative odorant receptor 13a [Trachymyrmex septentrionalis]